MLITVVAISGYATIGHNLVGTLRLGSASAEGLVMGEGGEVGDISLGRMDTIIKPITVPTAAPISHSPIVYLVTDNAQDLNGIAAKFSLSVNDLRWSNPWLGTDQPSQGARLLIPPVPGIVVTVKKSDTLVGLAGRYHADASTIVDFNYLRDPGRLPAGLALVIPNGVGPDLTTQASAPTAAPVPPNYGYRPAEPVFTGRIGRYSANRFAYGYCTWYVATRRSIPWLGDAWEWYGNAQAMGFAVGQKPRVGAIMVTWESAFGHVAYVEAVYPDGSWRISEMNYYAWGVVDQRIIHPGQVPLIGFIY